MFDLNYIDRALLGKKGQLLAGTDEVGRGPLAGPVVACSLSLHVNSNHKISDVRSTLKYLANLGIGDSKKISPIKRRKVLQQLEISIGKLEVGKVYKYSTKYCSLSYCLGEVSPREIDEINILQSALKAMKKSFLPLHIPRQRNFLLIDGNRNIDFGKHPVNQETVVKGDSKSLLIGLASIIAKEYRDYLMEEFDLLYPGYGLKNHAGYPTKAHKESIGKLGVTPIHRRTFAGVKEHVK